MTMAVKTDVIEDDKKILRTKEIVNKADSVQVAKIDSQEDDLKTSAIRTTNKVETQALIPLSITKPNSSKTVTGNVTVVGSKSVVISNGIYFNGPVKIEKLKHNVVNHKNSIKEIKFSESTQTSKGLEDKSSDTKFQIRRWHVNTLGTAIILTLGGIVAIFSQNQNFFTGYSKTQENDFEKSIGYFSIHRLFYENINFIIVPLIIVPLILLLMANALLRFNYRPEIKKKTLEDTEEVYNDFMRPDREVKTAIITSDGIRIVSRTVWKAEPVIERLEKLRQPAPWVIICHTATEGGNKQIECNRHMRAMQRYHKDSKDWDDIGYNFVIGGDGAVYCGRGWDHIGAHTLGYNKYSIGIAFLGTFNVKSPTKRQVETCKKLLLRGVALGKIADNYKMLGHRQLWATHSPGDKLYDIIKTWPHFVKEFNDISELIPDY